MRTFFKDHLMVCNGARTKTIGGYGCVCEDKFKRVQDKLDGLDSMDLLMEYGSSS